MSNIYDDATLMRPAEAFVTRKYLQHHRYSCRRSILSVA